MRLVSSGRQHEPVQASQPCPGDMAPLVGMLVGQPARQPVLGPVEVVGCSVARRRRGSAGRQARARRTRAGAAPRSSSGRSSWRCTPTTACQASARVICPRRTCRTCSPMNRERRIEPGDAVQPAGADGTGPRAPPVPSSSSALVAAKPASPRPRARARRDRTPGPLSSMIRTGARLPCLQCTEPATRMGWDAWRATDRPRPCGRSCSRTLRTRTRSKPIAGRRGASRGAASAGRRR